MQPTSLSVQRSRKSR